MGMNKGSPFHVAEASLLMQNAQLTRDQLERLTRDELRELARGADVRGFGSMRKVELVAALLSQTNEAIVDTSPATTPTPNIPSSDASAGGGPRIATRSRRLVTDEVETDSLLLEAMDSRWLRASWQLTSRALDRLAAAMGTDWHLAAPVLRLFRLTCDDAGPRSKSVVQDLPLPVDVRQWFISTGSPGGTWQVELGYLSKGGRFLPLMHSLPCQLPESARAHKRVSVTVEETGPPQTSAANPSEIVKLEVELLICGQTLPGARVSVDRDKIAVDRNGQFEMTVPAPDGRMVLPIEINTSEHRQRVLMALERNTRFLEPETEHGDG